MIDLQAARRRVWFAAIARNPRNDLRLLVVRHVVEKWQAHQTVRDGFADRAIADASAESAGPFRSYAAEHRWNTLRMPCCFRCSIKACRSSCERISR